MVDEKKCPICGAGAGAYRLGTCSPGCEMATGEPESPLALVAAALYVAAIICLFVWAVTSK